MKFYIANPKIDAEIRDIRRKIRLSMNGIISEQMKESGIIYKTNFGVSIPRLKEIAKLYAPNHDLAQRLWDIEIRETKILSTMLQPIDTFTPKMAQQRVESFDQIEIVEQNCMNLFNKLLYSNVLCIEWVQNEKSWIQITGFMLAARIVEKLSENDIESIVEMGIKASKIENFHLYKAVALCLSRFCRKNKAVATFILKEIKPFEQSKLTGQRYIWNEVTQEILFLDNK